MKQNSIILMFWIFIRYHMLIQSLEISKQLYMDLVKQDICNSCLKCLMMGTSFNMQLYHFYSRRGEKGNLSAKHRTHLRTTFNTKTKIGSLGSINGVHNEEAFVVLFIVSMQRQPTLVHLGSINCVHAGLIMKVNIPLFLSYLEFLTCFELDTFTHIQKPNIHTSQTPESMY